MIVFDRLAKHYGSFWAVDNLSFVVQPGKVTGFLGPNGAGKTTTMRMSTGLIRPDAGQVTFDGKPYAKLAKPATKVGVSMEPVVFHPGRTAMDHLMMLAPYAGAGKQRCKKVLDMVGLADVANKRVGKFSLGMRGRLNLAAAMLGDPGIVMLDEPINGLDPEGIRWIRELMQSLAAEGRTVLVSSHLLSEVEQTVDDLVIIAHGRLVYSGTLADLEASRTTAVSVKATDPDGFRYLARTQGWTIQDGPNSPDGITVEGVSPAEIGAAALNAGIVIEGLTAHSSDLESIFLQLTEGQGDMR